MNWFQLTWEWLLPATDDLLVRGQAGLVIATCLGLIVTLFALVLTWRISGDLQTGTVIFHTILALFLVSISLLAHAGSVSLAAWLLVLLLLLSVTSVVFPYGVASASATGYLIPIALAASSLGLWSGFGIAGFSSVVIWLLAWGERAGWYKPKLPPHSFHLTFNAPTLTTIFLLMALITGFWTHFLGQTLPR